jgi:hypothetical protein
MRFSCRSPCQRGLRRGSAAARLLRMWVRNPRRTWMSAVVSADWFVGRGRWEKLITRLEESYRMWCVVCVLETSWMKRPWPTGGFRTINRQTHNVTLWRVRVTTVAVKTHRCFLLELFGNTSLLHQYSSTKCCTKLLLWRITSPVTKKRAYVFT